MPPTFPLDENGREVASRSASSTAFHELLLASIAPIIDPAPSTAEPDAGQPLQALEPPASPTPVTQQTDQTVVPEPLSSSSIAALTSTAPTAAVSSTTDFSAAVATPVATAAPTATISTNAVATIVVGATVAGSTPQVLGYNLGHFRQGSNAADWWRYSGVKAARAFIRPSDIEPIDDITEVGDGVSDQASFASRRSALRANAANVSVALDSNYVNWTSFSAAYQKLDETNNNKFAPSYAFTELRAQGVSILANITASPSRLPLANSEDWANAWELWQHYYAQAFLLGRDYDIERYGMFNEPNNWTWPKETTDKVGNWLRRLQLASDAIQSALADVNSRYGTALRPQIFAPNTANGATKYNDTAAGNTWGREAVLANHTRWDGAYDPNWSNFHVYNYQKYDTLAADYVSDYQALRSYLNVDGATAMPLALTEFNVRTGDNYDARTETLDSPSDYAALGANNIALSEVGASQLYLFKFAQTERSGGTYPVAKNGTHYVQNGSGTLNNYGGATKGAETYRLFVKGSGSGRQRLTQTSTAGSAVWSQVTRESSDGRVWAFLANTGSAPVDLELDFTALGLAEGSLAVVEEVSEAFSGGVARVVAMQAGKLPVATLPGQATWLVSMTPAVAVTSRIATEDTQLADGTGKGQAGGSATGLVVRSDGTVDGRRVSLLKFNVQQLPTDLERVLLNLSASTLSLDGPVQAHLYGLSDDTWSEASSTWSSLGAVLRQNVSAGNQIAHNVVANQGSATTILGQLLVSGSTARSYQLDVSDFVRSQSDGWASILVVQDHRWDTALPSKTSGDTQADGLRISSREAGSGLAPELQLLTRTGPVSPPPPAAPVMALAADNGTSATDGLTNNGTIIVSGLLAGASWQYSTDNAGTWTNGAGNTFTLSAGTYASGSLQVRQTNFAGSTSAAAANASAITIDLTAPSAPVFALAADTGTSSTDRITNNSTFNVTGLEALGSWQFSSDSGNSWSPPIASSVTTFSLIDNTYAEGSIRVRQSDRAGNLSVEAATTAATTIDTAAPLAPTFRLTTDTGTSSSDWISSNGAITVSGLATGNPWQFSSNGGSTWTTGTGSAFTLAAGSYAANAIQVRQRDVADNISNAALNSSSIVIDATAPTITNQLVGGSTLILRFSEPIAFPGATATRFAVSNGKSNVTVTGLSVAVDGLSITLTLDGQGIASTSLLTVAYTDPNTRANNTTGAIEDIAGNDQASLAATTIRTFLASTSVSMTSGFNTGYTGVELTTAPTADNASITGNASGNTLTGNATNNAFTGAAGADILTGGGSSDDFRYAANSESLLGTTNSPGYDRITDLAIGTDTITHTTTFSAASGSITNKGSIASLTAANISALLTSTTFAASTATTGVAAAFSVGSDTTARTFLALNDNTAGYQAASDALIEITGFSGSLANLAIG